MISFEHEWRFLSIGIADIFISKILHGIGILDFHFLGKLVGPFYEIGIKTIDEPLFIFGKRVDPGKFRIANGRVSIFPIFWCLPNIDFVGKVSIDQPLGPRC